MGLAGLGSVDFDSIQLDSVRSGSIHLDSVGFGSVRFELGYNSVDSGWFG